MMAAVGRYLPLESLAVFLFGSMAEGRGKRYSDYDVGLWGRRPISYGTLAKMEEELEGLPVDVELVDFTAVSQDFRRVALQKVDLWNVPKNGLPWRSRA